MVRGLLLLLTAAMLAACQMTPEVAELQTQNAALQDELDRAQRRIEKLERRENALQDEIKELQRVTNVLAVEKTSRVRESSQLRKQARSFIQQQIEDFKTFLVEGDLLDYVGSELVERSRLEKEPLTLVDFEHPVPRSGSLTGVTGFFAEPTEMQLKVLRPVNNKYVVIWESDILRMDQSGRQTAQLPVAVGVEPDDLIAYDFPETVAVSFDKGTGDTRYTSQELVLGDAITPSALSGKNEKRAYSLGVFAILE